ncbi:MAG: M16 family metallopeptidase [Bacteriovoracia bacterium]
MRNLFLTLALFSAVNAQAAIELKTSGPKTNFIYEQDSKDLAATVELVFRTGSISDPKGKEGITELSFQSLFRGTKDKDRKEFYAALERLGASISADTGTNRSIVTLTVVSENLAPALELLAEAVLSPGLKDDEIHSLAEEKLAQLQQELASNRSVMKRIFRQAVYQGTPLAFPADGTIEGVKAVHGDDVRAFLSQHVKSENVIFAIASNRPEKEVRRMITKLFAALPEGEAPAAPKFDLSRKKGRILYVAERKGSSTTELAIGGLGIKADRPDRLTLEAGEFVFGEGGMGARLFKTLRSANGWTYGASSGFDLLDLPRRFGGAYMFYAFPQAQHTEKLTLKALEMYGDYVKKGVTAEELDFTKKSMSNSYAFKFATSRSRLNSRLYQVLDNGPLLSVNEYRAQMTALTPFAILKALQKAHEPENLAIVTVGDPEQIEGLKKSIPNLKAVVKITDPMKPL